MLNRYHKKVFTTAEHWEKLKSLTNRLNVMKWSYSIHSLDNLRHRIIGIESILRFIKNTVLDYNTIFEYYLNNNEPEKICYRLNYNSDVDLILVLSNTKNIITIYINEKNDNHLTLNKNLYRLQ